MEVQYDMTNWNKVKKEYYKKDKIIKFGNGIVDFNPESMKDFDCKDLKSYDEYLDIQWRSVNTSRTYLEMCYYKVVDYWFKGKVEKITKNALLFKRVLINGVYDDGTGFKGIEDHVWIDKAGFEGYKVGDCVSFYAEIYRYIKKNNGKLIDFGLRNPNEIELVSDYEIPTNEDLINQQIEELVCETCLFRNHCYRSICVANTETRQETINFLKQLEPGRFTQLTVLAAYEIAGQVFTQMTQGEIDKDRPDYEICKKILNEATKMNHGCIWPLEDAMFNMLYPQKSRIYI